MNPSETRFDEAWQAQAYALAHALSERGLFTWTEWTETFGAELRKHSDDDGTHYYDAYLCTLEAIVVAKGAANIEELGLLKDAWEKAYESTPHGKPVELGHVALKPARQP